LELTRIFDFSSLDGLEAPGGFDALDAPEGLAAGSERAGSGLEDGDCVPGSCATPTAAAETKAAVKRGTTNVRGMENNPGNPFYCNLGRRAKAKRCLRVKALPGHARFNAVGQTGLGDHSQNGAKS